MKLQKGWGTHFQWPGLLRETRLGLGGRWETQ